MTAARDPNAPSSPEVEAAFQAVPETMVAEIVDGELHTMPRPARRPDGEIRATTGSSNFGRPS